jgi:hydroxymethylpyrimidine pyrophosphatase-like HAD family hydrolase
VSSTAPALALSSLGLSRRRRPPSDLDGTIVHYQDGDRFTWNATPDDDRTVLAQFASDPRPTPALLLPPTTSGARGVISRRTIEMFAALRALGVKVAFISGCRVSTLLQRLPFLPAADAYVCESGGRIMYPDDSLPTALPIKEDMEWRRSHAAAAPPELDHLGPAARGDPETVGPSAAPLWQQYRILEEAGLKLDALNYTTAFRVKLGREEWLAHHAADLLPELAVAENLGAVDIYPSTSGKRQAAVHLMKRFGASCGGDDSVFLCDDDNDIELARAVSRAFLPSVTSDSMRWAIESAPQQFVVATRRSVWATEEILQHLLNEVMQQSTD